MTMPTHAHRSPWLWSAMLCGLIAISATAIAADVKPTAVTTADPEIGVEELALLLKPLTKEELAVEADGWLALLKAKVTEISRGEIAVRKLGATPQPAPQAAATTAPTTQAAEELAKKKDVLLEKLTKLREQRTALIDRLNTVLAAYRTKGGDPAQYDLYVKAVSGINVDVKDVNATWKTILGWLQSPQGGIRWGLNIAKFVATLLAFWILARILGGATRKAISMTRRVSNLLGDFLVNIVRKVVFLIGVVIALSALEVPIGPFVAAIGAAGFVIGFALQGTLSNFAAGVMILLYRPYDLGDVVSVAGVTGTVESMSLVSTSIKTPDNQTVIIPNNSIWGGIITNITGNDTRRVDMTFGIGYEDDIARAQETMLDILKSHPLVLDSPEPVVKLHELADSSVNFVCRPWARTSDYWTVYWDITRAVKERFDAEGISIPYPQRDVHLYQHVGPPEPQETTTQA